MKKYLLLYYRNLRKERAKILNIISIGLTLTFAILILFFIEDELSYDKWNSNLNNIYRITTQKNGLPRNLIKLPRLLELALL